MKKTILKIYLFIVVALLSLPLKAANYYWVGGSGNWSDIAHWATSSGGTVYYSVVPSQNDNVIFDANSGFTSTNKTVTIDVTANCNNLTWQGAPNNPIFTSILYNTSISLNVYGSFTLQPGMVYSVYSTNFKSSLPGQTITTNGVKLEIPNTTNAIVINFDGSGGWILQDQLNTYAMLQLVQGNLNTNNQEIFAERINSNSNINRTLSLGSSVIRLSSLLPWDTWPNNFNLDAGKSQIIAEGGYTFRGFGLNFNDITLAKNTQIYFQKANTLDMKDGGFILMSVDAEVNNLVLSQGKSYLVEVGKTLNINQTITANGQSCSDFSILKSTVDGTTTNINLKPGSTAQLNGVMVKDIKFTGNVSITATNSYDLGNNTNITFSSPASRNLYWIGGGGNWSDLSHWSTTSGGSADVLCKPTPSDHVFFDQNSGFGASNNFVRVDGVQSCKNMTWNGATNNPIIQGGYQSGYFNGTLNIFGSVVLQSGMKYEVPLTYFKATEAGQTIATNGVQWGNNDIWSNHKQIYMEGTGSWKLLDDLTTPFRIMLSQGGLDTNGVNLKAADFIAYENTNLKLGSSTITVNAWLCYSNSFDAGTSLIKGLGGQYAFKAKSGHRYHNITVSDPVATPFQNFNAGGTLYANIIDLKSNQHFYDTNLIVNQLLLSPGKTYIFDGGKTQTINHKFSAGGTLCEGFTTLKSYNSGSKTTINFAPGSQKIFGSLAVKDIAFTGDGTPISLANSVDLGNTSGINFSGNTVQTLYWIGGAGNWNDAQHWSTTSGGTSTAECYIPTNGVNVVFDQNSGFTSGNNVVNIESEAYCKDMSWINAPNNPILRNINWGGSSMIPLSIYGSLLLQKEMSFEINYIHFKATSPNQTINPNGFTGYAGSWTMDGTGGWIFQDNGSFIGDISLINGNLNTNNKNLSFGNFYVNGGNLSLGSSTITLRETWYYNTNNILNAGTSTIIFYDTINGSNSNFISETTVPQTYYNLSFQTKTGAASSTFITGNFNANDVLLTNNTATHRYSANGSFPPYNMNFNKIILPPSKTLTITERSTITVNQNAYLSGNPCRKTTIQSTGPQQGNLKILGGSTSFDFVNISNINASNSYQQLSFAGHSTNGGNNTNMVFAPTTTEGIEGLGADKAVLPSGFPYTITTDLFYPNPYTTFVWGDGSTGNTLVVSQPGTYTVTVKYGDGCSVPGTVKINPSAPTIKCTRVEDKAVTGTSGFPGGVVTINIPSLSFTGTGTIDASGNWSVDISSVALQVGTSISAFQTVNGMQSESSSLLATPKGEPFPPTVISPQNFKPSQFPNPTVANLVATGQNLLWYDVPVGGNPLPLSTPLSAKTYYVTQTVGICTSERAKVVVTLTENPCGMPGVISYRTGKIVGCTKVGYKNLSESTEITGIANPPTINGSFKYIINTGVVGRESDKFYKFENVAGTPVSTLPNQNHIQGKVVYDDASDHFYERTDAGWMRIDN